MTDAPSARAPRFTFRRKLALAIVLAALVPLVTASIVSFLIARDSLVASAENRLSLMRDEKARGLTEYFEDFARTLRLLAAGPAAREAAQGLIGAWARLPGEMGWPLEGQAVDAAAAQRRDASLRALAEYHLGAGRVRAADTGAAASACEAWGGGGTTVPGTPAAQAAQVLFLSENPNPPEAKHLLLRPTLATTAYGDVHARFHGYAGRTVAELKVDDLFLVDATSGDVVYSFAKGLDFGANVRTGALAQTGLARASRRALESSVAEAVMSADYELYAPAGGVPEAFMATPVRLEGRTLAALVLRIPVGHVNELLAPEPGAAPSTETFLVGADRLMRSDSRFSTETTVLRKRLDSLPVRESLAGNSGVGVTDDDRGVPSVVAWRPLEVLGVTYGLVRKVDTARALAPVRRLMLWMLAIAGALVLLALLAGAWMARSLARPVARATERLEGMATSLLSTAQEQQAGAAESAAAVEETRQTFQGVLGAAQNLRKVGTEVLSSAEISQRNAQTIGRRIQDLSGTTANIGEILTLVKEIANRSDLLALNAALEGTKAGEAGRGFSLVATQMQRLAEEVMSSVKRIEGLTRDITKSSAGAVLAAEEADKVAAQTTTSAQHIAEAVQVQQSSTEQVAVAMNEIATVAQNSVEAARHIVTSSNELLSLAQELRRVMGTAS